MKRKVNRVGTNTLTVSLPSKWVKQMGIKAGDEIDLSEQHGTLNISATRHARESQQFRLELSEESLSDKRYLVSHLDSLYISGFDKIIVELPRKEKAPVIQQLIKSRYLGYEITSFEGSQCTIEKIADITDEKFENILRRLFVITKQLAQDMITDIEKGLLDNLDLHKEQSYLIDTYSNYCLRVIAHTPQVSSFALWSIVLRTSQVYHILLYCYEHLLQYGKPSFDKTVIKMFKNFLSLFGDVSTLFYKYDIKLTRKIHKGYSHAFKPHLYDLLLSKKNGELFFVFHLAKAARQLLYLTNFITVYHSTRKISG